MLVHGHHVAEAANIMAERGGFEPPIEVLAPITV
jgi:hypothetical protein